MCEKFLLTASWCGPCGSLKPVVNEVLDENPGVDVQILDIMDEGAELASKFRIRGVPTFLVVEGGEVKKSHTGILSKAEIIDFFTNN